MIERIAGPRPDDIDVERPRALRVFATAEGLAGLVVLVALTLVIPIRDPIAIRAIGISPDSSRILGAAFWIGFGLLGNLRSGPRPGGSVLTFSTPFIVAGIVLGGPVVGMLMGLISEFEPRELRLPWYGVVTNHANVILSAAIAGLIAHAFDDAFLALLGASALRGLATAILTSFVFTTMNAALVVPVLAFRTGSSLGDASRSYNMTLRRTVVAETILAWLMATTYVVVGWWAPLVCITLVVVIWRFQAQQDALIRDPRTGLLNDLGFMPIAEAAVRAGRAGRRFSMLLFFDLDSFSAVNNRYGQDAGDEVIAAIARRVQTAVRATDTTARRNRAGDEFLLLYENVGTVELALRLANRLHDRIIEPITLRGTGVSVAVGASIGICILGLDPVTSLEGAFKLVEHRSHLAKQTLYGPDGRRNGRLSGGVGPMAQLDGAMASFEHEHDLAAPAIVEQPES